MPPHLHPRSTATSTLFAGTLLASFVVVAIPHVLPCPRPRRVGYQDTEVVLDTNGKPIRRVRKRAQVNGDAVEQEATSSGRPPQTQTLTSKSKTIAEETEMFRQLKEEAEVLDKESKRDRECPVPKPRTVLERLWTRQSGKATTTTTTD